MFTGLYWRRRRPQSHFGPLLIAVGLLCIPYILQSSAVPWAFSVGVIWEGVIHTATLALILAFPTGRLDGLVVRLLLAAGVVGTGFIVIIETVAPTIAPFGPISGCLAECPENGLFISPDVPLALRLIDVNRAIVVVSAIVAIAVIVHRFLAGTPPRRRALSIGVPIAVFCLLTQAAYQGSTLIGLDTGAFHTAAQWAIAGSRATLWYGFLLALVAAELFAGRVLHRIVEASLQRPSLRGLEAMLREPLGDPELRLAFWSPAGWIGGDGEPVASAPDRVLTVVEHEDRPAVAVLHDPQLAEDPELVHAAGAIASMARENAQLEEAWNEALRELSSSRARLAAAADVERRALERDLHDGAQQRLTAILLKLSMLREFVADGSVAHTRIVELEDDLVQALEELRRLAHGIYPAPLAESGLVGALELVARRSGGAVQASAEGVGRYPPAIESAVYFCCLEAVQNASRHAGPHVHISIRLQGVGQMLRFQVRDDGSGFDPDAALAGTGLQNLRDRLHAFGGRLEIVSAPGRGTVVAGALPVA